MSVGGLPGGMPVVRSGMLDSARAQRLALPAMGVAAGALGLLVARDVLLNARASGDRGETLVFEVLGGWSFILAGIVARAREPGSRVGWYMVAVGFTWLATGLRWTPESSLVLTLWAPLGWLWAALLAGLVVSFPTGRLTGRPARMLAIAALVVAVPIRIAWIVLADQPTFNEQILRPPHCHCPTSLLSTGIDPPLAATISSVDQLAVTVIGLGVCGLVARRWHDGTPVQRRAIGPVLVISLLTALATALSTAATVTGHGAAADAFAWVFNAGILALPFAFVGGILRTRLRGAAGLAQFIERLDGVPDPQRLDAAIGRALGDDSLEVAYWLPDDGRYVAADGSPVALPSAQQDRAVTPVELDGRPVAALIHDPLLAGEARTVRAAGRTAVLWLERARFEAERNARIMELRDSRTRLVEATDAERRRIERDLHDGAQQRLAGILLQAKLRRRDLDVSGDVDALLADLERGVADALTELRSLAAGILPPALVDHGVVAAIEELAARSPVPVTVRATVTRRPAPAVEAAAYFVVAEALANVIKHARAERVTVGVEADDERVVVEIRDDGVGGARSTGSGLTGLADRVGALGGTLRCLSTPGGGTTIRAEIPCGS